MSLNVKVSRDLGLMLKILSILGVSFVSITPATDGYFVKFSYATTIYSYCCVTLNCIIVVIALIVEIVLSHYLSFRKLLDIAIIITYSIIICCTGVTRTKSLLEILNNLNKIRNKINCVNHDLHSVKKRNPIISLTLLVLWTIMYDTIFISKLISSVKDLAGYISLSVIYHYLQISMIEIVIWSQKNEVYKTLKILSKELHIQLNFIKSGSRLNFGDVAVITVSSTQKNIRNVVNAFIGICKVVNKINETDGGSTYFLIFFFIFYLSLSIGDVIFGFQSNDNLLNIMYTIFWIFIFSSRLYVLLDPCYFISKEVEEIKVLLSKLMCEITETGKSYSWEWDLIFLQLKLTDPTFRPLEMFTLNRSFCISIISVVTTYMAIAIPQIQTIYMYLRLE